MLNLDTVRGTRCFEYNGVVHTYNLTWSPIGNDVEQDICRAIEYIQDEIEDEAFFDFNGIRIVVNRNSKKQDILDKYLCDMKAKSKAWKVNPEGIKHYKREADRLRHNTQIVTNALAKLNNKILTSPLRTCRWLATWIQEADDNRIHWDKFTLAKRLEAAGYKNKAFIDQPEKLDNLENACRYIIGQAISNLYANVAPHSILAYWYKEKIKPMVSKKVKKPIRMRPRRNKVIRGKLLHS